MKEKDLITNNKKLSNSNQIEYRTNIIAINGITLISLVITIIILIILSGLAINFSIGEYGLFNKAKKVTNEYSEASSKEKLEIVLLDLQTQKINSERFDETDYIDLYISKNGMTVNGDIINVDGWQFQIDRSKLQIVSRLGKGEPTIINASYVGTSSFTIQLRNVPSEDEVESYSYVIDNSIKATNLEKEYTIDKQEAETNHIAKVIVKYKNGATSQSNVLNIKLAPRTYLYNKGNECVDITGGWNGFKFEHVNKHGVEAAYYKKYPTYLEFGDNSTTKFGDGGFTTVNKIDTTTYANLYMSIKNFSCNFIPRDGYPEAFNGYSVSIGSNVILAKCYQENTNLSEIVKIDLRNQNLNDVLNFHTYCVGWGLNGQYIASCQIDRIWLEK